MPRIVPVSFSALATLALFASGCGSSGEEATVEPSPTTVTVVATSSTTAPSTSVSSTTIESTTTTTEPTTTTTEATTTTVDEIAPLCDAYLQYLVPSSIDAGIASMRELLGSDAPPGVQDAFEVYTEGTDDIERFFEAQAAIDGYVRPICAERFAAGTTPAASAEDAATDFHATLVAGNRAAAEQFVSDDVLAQFDWDGYPDAAFNFSAQNDTMSMILAPTVTVFCEINNGIVDRCLFGE